MSRALPGHILLALVLCFINFAYTCVLCEKKFAQSSRRPQRKMVLNPSRNLAYFARNKKNSCKAREDCNEK